MAQAPDTRRIRPRTTAPEHRMALARGSRAQNLGIPVWSTVAFAGCTEYT